MCDTHHMMQGKTPAQCSRGCVKQGSDFAFASGGKVYTLKRNKTQFAEEKVTGNGNVFGTTISLDSITASKS
jgi:hypothetical protein